MSYQFAKDGTLNDMTDEELAAADADSSVIELSQGTLGDGTPYWAYSEVKPSKYKKFKLLTAADAAHSPLRLRQGPEIRV